MESKQVGKLLGSDFRRVVPEKFVLHDKCDERDILLNDNVMNAYLSLLLDQSAHKDKVTLSTTFLL